MGTSRVATGFNDAGQEVEEVLPTFIVGDSAYPNARHIVTTYKRNETDRDQFIKLANQRLGKARCRAEHAFGILKKRFQILQAPLLCASEDLPFAIHFVASLFVLHNFLLDEQDEPQEYEFTNNFDEEEDEEGSGEGDERLDMLASTRNILLRHVRHLERGTARRLNQQLQSQ